MAAVLPGTLDFPALKEGFAKLVNQAEPNCLPAFILWLDLKVAQFKINGCMYAGKLRYMYCFAWKRGKIHESSVPRHMSFDVFNRIDFERFFNFHIDRKFFLWEHKRNFARATCRHP